MLYLYTADLFLAARAKKGLKKILGRPNLGPAQVFIFLAKGLAELGVEFLANEKIRRPIETACVLSGHKTLSWAIGKKQSGVLKKIIAGPNIVVHPNDFNGILKHRLIDKIVVPSQWVKEFYLKAAPELGGKIEVWAAGVDMPPLSQSEKKLDFLVFNKIGKAKLFLQITDFLKFRNLKFQTVSYGRFRQEEYFKLLSVSKNLIYLSQSESQGLAMLEAWARGVPTLVWEKGYFELNKLKIFGSTSSPYLSDQSGMRFKDMAEFTSVFTRFLQKRFFPREYALNNFSRKICAQKYLKIANG